MEQGWPGLAQYIPAVPADWSPRPRTVQDALDQLGARGGGAGFAASFVYRPGGTAADGVYTTPATLRAALNSVDSAANKVVSVDASNVGGTAHIGGGPWPDNITWQSGAGGVFATLALDEGTSWTGLTYRFRNLVVQTQNATPVMSVAAGVSANLVLDQGAVLQPLGAGNVFADVAGTLSCSIFESAIGDGTAGHALFALEATGAMFAFCFSGSTFADNSVKQGVAPGGVLGITYDGSAQSQVSATQVPVPQMTLAGPAPTFVWRPGAPAPITSTNTFSTSTALSAAMALCPGLKFLFLDSSAPGFAGFNVDAGTALNLGEGCTVSPLNVSTAGAFLNRIINFPDNATLAPFQTLFLRGGLVLQSSNTVGPVCTIPTGITCYLEHVAGLVRSLGVGAKPFFEIQTGGTFNPKLLANSVIGDGTNAAIQTDVGATTTIRCTGGIGSGSPSILANSLSGAGTTAVHASAETLVNTTQPGVTGAFNFVWHPLVNTTQATAVLGSGTGTVSVATGAVSRQKSGKMAFDGLITGTISGAGTVTVSLLRDAAPIGNPLPALTVLPTQSFAIPYGFIDTAPDLAPHTYTLQCVASGANTITTGVNGGQAQVIEQ